MAGTLTERQEPADVAVTTDGEHWYGVAGNLYRYDSLDDLYSGSPAATLEGDQSWMATIAAHQGRLYTTGLWPASELVEVINPDTLTVERTIPLDDSAGLYYWGFSITEAGMHLISTGPEGDPPRLVRYDLETGEIIGEMWLPRSIAPVMTGLVCETELE